jgi:hypothetical protein
MTTHTKLAAASTESASACETIAESSRFSFLKGWLPNQFRHVQSFCRVWHIAAIGGLLFVTYVVWLHWQMSYAFRSREAQRTLLTDAGFTVTGSVSPFWKIGALEVWPSNGLESSITRLKAVGTDFDTPKGRLSIDCIRKMGHLQKLSLSDCVQVDRLLSSTVDCPIDYLIVDGAFRDQDLELLLKMRDLKAVRLYSTHVTEHGVKAFHLKHPSLRIEVFSQTHKGDSASRDTLILGPNANEVICQNSIDKLQLWYPPQSSCAIDER